MPLKSYLDSLVARFEQTSFIASDPISVPHGFDDPRDREVIGLFAALLAWGRRETVLAKMEDLCERMRYQPYRFLRDYDDVRDGRRLEGFVHRTFQSVDALWLARSLSEVLRRYGGLERAFAAGLPHGAPDVGAAIQHFSETLLTAVPGFPTRTAKHLARPETGSACKRLCMYLRWMVRPGPVDFGIWTSIHPRQLVLPLDVHAGRSARALGLVSRRQNDWNAALELTNACRELSPEDPCRYDFAFFGSVVAGETVTHPSAHDPVLPAS